MLKAYVTNLGKYEEGYLVGQWLDFPASEKEVDKCFANIGISDKQAKEITA